MNVRLKIETLPLTASTLSTVVREVPERNAIVDDVIESLVIPAPAEDSVHPDN